MKYLVVLLSVIIAVSSQTCQVVDSYGFLYDLSSLKLEDGNQAYSYYDTNTSKLWYFNVCGFVDRLTSENLGHLSCSPSTSVCNTEDGSHFDSTGIYGWTILADGDMDTVVSLHYEESGKCSTESGFIPYKTTMRFVCDDAETLEVISIDESAPCAPIITVASIAACPMFDSASEAITILNVNMNWWIVCAAVAAAFLICCCFFMLVILALTRCASQKEEGACKCCNCLKICGLVWFVLKNCPDIPREEESATPDISLRNQPAPAPQPQQFPIYQSEGFYAPFRLPEYMVQRGQPSPIFLSTQSQVQSDEELAFKIQAALNQE